MKHTKRILSELMHKDAHNEYGTPTTMTDYRNALRECDEYIKHVRYLRIVVVIFILSLFTGLFSCSGHYHIKKAEKHTQKAINKGVKPTSDTTYIVTSDTLTEIDTVDNYIRITKTIRDTIKAECKTVYIAKSRAEVRQEQKTERTKIRQEAKTERKRIKQDAKTRRKQVKQDAKTERKKSFHWWIIVILTIIGVVLFMISQGSLGPKKTIVQDEIK